MPVEDPGVLTVTCDDCEETAEMATTSYAGEPQTFGVDDDTLAEAEWTREGSATYCPTCSEQRSNED